MCYELIDRIIIGGSQSVIGMEREIEIVYKIDILGKASTRILLILAKNKKITWKMSEKKEWQ